MFSIDLVVLHKQEQLGLGLKYVHLIYYDVLSQREWLDSSISIIHIQIFIKGVPGRACKNVYAYLSNEPKAKIKETKTRKVITA